MITINNTSSISITEKLKAYFELLKFRLSLLVAFSAAFGYVFGVNGQVNWLHMGIFTLGGFLISGASIVLNQIWEKDLDALMDRTKERPLPKNYITTNEALAYSIILLTIGMSILLAYTNMLTVSLAILSTILYSFVYTPLKRVGPIAVFVGAIPGALPPLLGWTAATGTITYEALIIFGIQFIWQFPHFWAIAWVLYDDYQKAGFKLLPSRAGRTAGSALQIMIYTMFLLPLSLLPALFQLTGMISAVVATICGCLFLAQTFHLMKDGSKKAALRIMFGSFLYLPVVQIAFLLDKIG